MINPQTPKGDHEDASHWLDHLQNAIDLSGANLTTAQSRILAEAWDNIFMEAESQQDNCPDCEREANNETLAEVDARLLRYAL
jgi:hypothetical protein